jgi:hypothetical protein
MVLINLIFKHFLRKGDTALRTVWPTTAYDHECGGVLLEQPKGHKGDSYDEAPGCNGRGV